MLKARDLRDQRTADLARKARVDGRFENNNGALLEHSPDRLARADNRTKIWTSISIDRCRHGDDEKADILQIFGARRQTQAGLAEFVLRNFPRTIDALAKFLNEGFRDIKPIDAVELSRERKSHRKSDIAESDHSKCFF